MTQSNLIGIPFAAIAEGVILTRDRILDDVVCISQDDAAHEALEIALEAIRPLAETMGPGEVLNMIREMDARYVGVELVEKEDA